MSNSSAPASAPAFAPSLALRPGVVGVSSVALSPSRPAVRISTSTPSKSSATPRMSDRGADVFISKQRVSDAKSAAASTGVYTVQCTEGTGGANTAEYSRAASLNRSFRLLQQTGLRATYADLYETRRAAIATCAGSHSAEQYFVGFPVAAAAAVTGRAEALRACSRYFPAGASPEADYMFKCVDRQYKQLRVPNGEYSTACADGLSAGDADTARVAALAADFRAGQLSTIQQTQQRYDAIAEANALGHGCDHEEAYFGEYPKTAAAMRYSTGAYAASRVGASVFVSGKPLSVVEQVEGVNSLSFWPSQTIRPGIARDVPWYKQRAASKYAVMSAAAVEYGLQGQIDPVSKTDASVLSTSPYVEVWSPGWQPASKMNARFNI